MTTRAPTASTIPQGRALSPWLDRPAPTPRAALASDLEVDVAVVGAGIVGLTAAVQLARAGAGVAVLEGRRIASGVTGNTTAKLSALHGLAYADLRSRHGDETGRAYAATNLRGLELIFELTESLAIECDLRPTDNHTYTEEHSRRGEVEEEVEAAVAAGLAAGLVEDVELPFPVAAAIRVPGQAQLDPVPYLWALADEVERHGGAVYEDTRVTGARGRVLSTAGAHSVAADRCVIATHLPILDRGMFFARADPQRSYAITVRPAEARPAGMYLSADSPTRSLRSVRHGGEELLLVGGESHRIGFGDPPSAFESLAAYARERFGASEVVHRWAAHDFIPEDDLPFVGAASLTSDWALTVTGLRKWGLAMGSAAAETLGDTILGGDRAWPEAFDSRRVPRPRSLGSLARHNLASGYRFAADRLRRRSRTGISPGEGRVVGDGAAQRAVYRDEAGEVHEMSARCPHLGCIVGWNSAERTWDCPCHGSRFGPLGDVIEGPAVAGLARDEE